MSILSPISTQHGRRAADFEQVLNSIAAYTVHKRNQCLQAGDASGYAKFNLLHERVGVGCILSIASAIVLGGLRISG